MAVEIPQKILMATIIKEKNKKKTEVETDKRRSLIFPSLTTIHHK
jgi:ribosomal protein S19